MRTKGTPTGHTTKQTKSMPNLMKTKVPASIRTPSSGAGKGKPQPGMKVR